MLATAAEGKLQAVIQQAREEAAAFCSENPDPKVGADGLTLTTVHVPGPENSTFLMWVHAADDTVSGVILRTHMWERNETERIQGKLEEYRQEQGLEKEDTWLVDIGANLGWHGLVAAFSGYSVIAFEPMSRNLAAIRRTMCETPQLQQRLTLIPKGLSDRTQTCSMYVNPANSGNGFTGCGSDAQNSSMTGFKKVGDFEMGRLDDILGVGAHAIKGKVAMLKIDVEGFEKQAYAGGACAISTMQPKNIFAEINGPALSMAGNSTPEEMFMLYDYMGYELRFGDNGFNGTPEDPKDATLSQRSGAAFKDSNWYLVRKAEVTQAG